LYLSKTRPAPFLNLLAEYNLLPMIRNVTLTHNYIDVMFTSSLDVEVQIAAYLKGITYQILNKKQ